MFEYYKRKENKVYILVHLLLGLFIGFILSFVFFLAVLGGALLVSESVLYIYLILLFLLPIIFFSIRREVISFGIMLSWLIPIVAFLMLRAALGAMA